MVAPWSLRYLEDEEYGIYRDNFNLYHRLMIIHVEKACEILVPRWEIIWKLIYYTMADRVLIVSVCMRLYNFAIENDGTGMRFLTSFQTIITADAASEWIRNCRELLSGIMENIIGQRFDLASSHISEIVTENLKIHGITRPVPS